VAKPRLKPVAASPGAPHVAPPVAMVTPWEVKLRELGGVTGDEALIRTPWENLERMAYHWLWLWT
jgi:hypothetical protein